jgi:hypothetical protein
MEMIHQLFAVIILSLAVASVSWTVTQEEIFREFRDYCEKKSEASKNLMGKKFFYLFICEYCFSHWVGLVFIVLSGFALLFNDWRGRIIAFFVIPWVSNQFMSLYRRLRVDIKHEKLLADEVEKNL